MVAEMEVVEVVARAPGVLVEVAGSVVEVEHLSAEGRVGSRGLVWKTCERLSVR